MHWIGERRPTLQRKPSIRSILANPAAAAWVQAIGTVVALALTYYLASAPGRQAEKQDSWFVDGYRRNASKSIGYAIDACRSKSRSALRSAAAELEVLADIGREFTSLGDRPERIGDVYVIREGIAVAQRTLPNVEIDHEAWTTCAAELTVVQMWYLQ